MNYYLDCEFDGYRGALLSMALVREDGPSIYLLTLHDAADEWVKENVVPILLSCPVPQLMAGDRVLANSIASFLEGDACPCIISDWPADIRYFCDLIEFPGGEMAPIPGLTFEMVRVDAYPTGLEGAVQHNAWWDAMALRAKIEGVGA